MQMQKEETITMMDYFKLDYKTYFADDYYYHELTKYDTQQIEKAIAEIGPEIERLYETDKEDVYDYTVDNIIEITLYDGSELTIRMDYNEYTESTTVAEIGLMKNGVLYIDNDGYSLQVFED